MERDLATQAYPTKKRGAIWLLASMVFFGGAFAYFILLAISAAIHGLTQSAIDILDTAVLLAGRSDGTGLSLGSHQLSRADLIGHLLLALSLLMSYLGIWYGAMLIVASYKKYTFLKTRVLALLLAICFAISYLFVQAVYDIQDQCQLQTQMQIDCAPFEASLVAKKITEHFQMWLRILVH
jgi:hypothetical protein